MEISARGPGPGGSSISFIYSDTVCPQAPSTFKGFQVTIKTAETTASEYSPIYFSEGNSATATEHAKIKLRNQSYPIRVRIIRSEGTVTVEYTTFMRFETLFQVDLETEIPDFGYFAIVAETEIDHSDNNDLYSIRTRAQTDTAYDRISDQILKNNRKIIESDALKRREAKQARREAMLPTMHHYLDLMAASNNELARSGATPDMRAAFDLVQEAAKRGMEAVTIDMLKVFINRYLQDTLAKAGKKVNLAMDNFEDTRGELHEMWVSLRGELVELATDTRAALGQIADEALTAARQVQLERWPRHLGPSFVERTAKARQNTGNVPVVLLVVMALELVAYLIFFIRQHSKTHGFKKVD
jgi:hypothetical protein